MCLVVESVSTVHKPTIKYEKEQTTFTEPYYYLWKLKYVIFCSFPVESSGLLLRAGYVNRTRGLQDRLDDVLIPLVQGLHAEPEFLN